MKTIFGSLLLIFILFVIAVDAAVWTQKFPEPKPSARHRHAMAYTGGDKVLLFGGAYGSHWDDETWIYDPSDNTWTQKFPEPKPLARFNHAIAYIGGNKALLFGGAYDDDDASYCDDTWIYDFSDNTWTQKFPDSHPSARSDHAMVYIGGDKVLLFGGSSAGGDILYDDTWVYNLNDNTWTQKFPEPRPPARGDHGMAYIGEDKALLFGGAGPSNYDDTWVYDFSVNIWTQKFPSSKPLARYRHAMAYIGEDKALLFGGEDVPRHYLNDTWVYNLSANKWTQDITTNQPSGRIFHALSETSVDGSGDLVLFGGLDASGYDDETWTYGPVWFRVYGRMFKDADSEAALPLLRRYRDEILIKDSQGEKLVRQLYEEHSSELAQILLSHPRLARRGASIIKENLPEIAKVLDGEQMEMSRRQLAKVEILLEDVSNVSSPELKDYIQSVQQILQKEHLIRLGVTVKEDMEIAQKPKESRLLPNKPNPFNPDTWIPYALSESADVIIRIYNVSGKLVRTLDLGHKPAGFYVSKDKAAYWNGKNEAGEQVASGVYFYQLKAGDFTATKKMLMVK